MKRTVYLAGPMEGCTEAHMTGWRNEAAYRLGHNNINVLDPCRRKALHLIPPEQRRPGLIFYSDIRDVTESDILLVDGRVSSGRAAGTHMELGFAYSLRKPMVIWVDPQDHVHPFYPQMAISIVTSLDAAVDDVLDFLDK